MRREPSCVENVAVGIFGAYLPLAKRTKEEAQGLERARVVVSRYCCVVESVLGARQRQHICASNIRPHIYPSFMFVTSWLVGVVVVVVLDDWSNLI